METNHKKTFPTGKDLFAILGIFLAANVLAGISIALVSGKLAGGLMTFISYTGIFAVTIAAALTLSKRRSENAPKLIRISFKGFNPAMILWGLILMTAVSVIIEPLIALFPKEWYEPVKQQITTGGWATLTAVVMAPICEEILFRGIIQNSLTRKRGPWSGILIASALFGLIHGVPQQVVAGFCLGIVIGLVYYKTGSLLAVMVLHAINNALATFLSLFENEDNPEETIRQMIDNDMLYGGIYAFSALLLVISLVRVQASVRRRPPENHTPAEN